MGDWEFLDEMHELGCSAEEIAAAAASGAAPWEWDYLDKEWLESELERVTKDVICSSDKGVAFHSRGGFPYSLIEQGQILEDLVDCARRHFENTGRYLQIWGELGEIYSEIRFGLRRHGTHTAGSDGTIDDRRVEVKTISPEKTGDRVLIKSQGDFEQLLIVQITKDFQFRGKLFNRADLKGGSGKYLKVRFGR